LNDAVARAQSQFIKGRDKREGIVTLLNDIVLLTGSRYGQVCKVQQGKTGDYILKITSAQRLARTLIVRLQETIKMIS
jgi:hypothetical protein